MRRRTAALVVLSLIAVVGGSCGPEAEGIESALRSKNVDAEVAASLARTLEVSGHDAGAFAKGIRALPEFESASEIDGRVDAVADRFGRAREWLETKACKAAIGALQPKWKYDVNSDGTITPRLDGSNDLYAEYKSALAAEMQDAAGSGVALIANVYEAVMDKPFAASTSTPDFSPDNFSVWVQLQLLKRNCSAA